MSLNIGVMIILFLKSSIKSWTASQRTALVEERNRKIVEAYLRAWNTLESIGEVYDIEASTVKRTIDLQIAKSGETQNDFKPFIYNIWNTPKQDHEINSSQL